VHCIQGGAQDSKVEEDGPDKHTKEISSAKLFHFANPYRLANSWGFTGCGKKFEYRMGFPLLDPKQPKQPSRSTRLLQQPQQYFSIGTTTTFSVKEKKNSMEREC